MNQPALTLIQATIIAIVSIIFTYLLSELSYYKRLSKYLKERNDLCDAKIKICDELIKTDNQIIDALKEKITRNA